MFCNIMKNSIRIFVAVQAIIILKAAIKKDGRETKMKIKMIKVVIKKPMENPYEVHIQNTLESLHACVDGLI